ncbi:NOL1/NOP2/sun family putative RNA methylase [Candidatus Woesearchaeota archaeon]|nr:NOL1/NOP2/sun family putative RNA methylase [Candidatus Woesearchaeota archaeon]
MPERIPGTERLLFKPKFIERYQSLLGDRYNDFITYSLSWIRKCIRVNTLKISVPDLVARLKNWRLTPISWCREGFYIEGSRYDVGNLLEHVLGYIYIQESASMIPPVVLDPQPGDRVLDLCASPGSKTSQLAQYMNNSGVLLANDISHDRLAPLGLNLQRCGVTNVVVTMMTGQRLAGLQFDRILVDAPCSGVGTIRRSLRTIRQWNPQVIKVMAVQQRKLLKAGFGNLKPGGVLVYSTCTLEPEEDEGVVSWLLDNEPAATVEKIEMDIKRSSCVTEFDGIHYRPEVKNCLRLWPQDNDSEGFFVAKIRKAT